MRPDQLRRTGRRLGAAVAVALQGAVVVCFGPASGDAGAGTDGGRRPTTSPPTPAANETVRGPVVVLYGDSLAGEARDHFVDAFRDLNRRRPRPWPRCEDRRPTRHLAYRAG